MPLAPRDCRFLRYLAVQCLTGCAVALLFGVLLLVSDAGGIGGLITSSENPLTGLLLFLGGAVIAILPVVVTAGIGMLPYEERVAKPPAPIRQNNP
jgi:hypothetical protein